MLNLGVIILAGGLSSRMGYPKALLPWTNGESLISHALRNALEHDANDILISIGDDESLGQAIQANIIDTLSNKEKEKVSIVRDSVPRSGPLGGLYSTLAVGKSHAYAVLAVDMPFMDFNLYYDWLYQVEGDDWRVIVPIGESGRYEPMAGIYKPSIAPLLLYQIIQIRLFFGAYAYGRFRGACNGYGRGACFHSKIRIGSFIIHVKAMFIAFYNAYRETNLF